MKATSAQVMAGQQVYTKRLLAIYDVIVLGLSSHYIWRCPSSQIESLYNNHVSANHLDVGVGTGYFLDRCVFPVTKPRIGLMDLNENSLAFAANRIARFSPETHRHNVLEPLIGRIDPFDSISMNYLLHCVPGSIDEKAVLFDHLKSVMNPRAKIFGGTIVQDEPVPWSARQLMKLYNHRSIFNNASDDVRGLARALNERFEDVTINRVGCVALFSGLKGA